MLKSFHYLDHPTKGKQTVIVLSAPLQNVYIYIYIIIVKTFAFQAQVYTAQILS
jgi:hypothetical protein